MSIQEPWQLALLIYLVAQFMVYIKKDWASIKEGVSEIFDSHEHIKRLIFQWIGFSIITTWRPFFFYALAWLILWVVL